VSFVFNSKVWFGISGAFQKEGRLYLKQFGRLISNERAFSLPTSMIWFACVWCIWKAKNGKCFHNKKFS